MHRMRIPWLLTAVAGALGVPAVASAQTVNMPQGVYPNRTEAYRPQNLNPQGVNYSDCAHAMKLTFPLVVSAFDGTQNLTVWASLNSDCTATADRGVGGVTGQLCWRLDGGFVGVPYKTTSSIQVDVYVQDAMAHMNGAVPFTQGVTHGNASSCSQQASPVGAPIQIDFVPLDSNNQNVQGTAYQYSLNVDVLGPPAPTGIGKSVGHTLINMSWTPNVDTDTLGYNVFIDPIPGHEPVGVGDGGDDGGEGGILVADSSVLVCPDSGSVVGVDAGDDSGDAADGATDGGDDGSLDATSSADASADATVADAATQDAGSSSTDGGCYTRNQGGSSTTNVCTSSLLTSGFVSDAGSTTVVDEASTSGDDASGDDSGTSTTTTGPGGISTIPDANRVGNYPTVADKSLGQYQITGLIDGVHYNMVVAAVDGYGNVGAASTEVCDFPQPVQDFWGTYEGDGGQAGGFCALDRVGGGGPSLAGVAGILAATAIMRRRRRQP
jgi:hypothetical protein